MLTENLTSPNDLEAFWIPFTPNKLFKSDPRLLTHAEGMHYTSMDGRKILDATAGLWCCNAGHGRERIVKAVQSAGGSSSISRRPSSSAIRRRSSWPPDSPICFRESLDYAFFTNSGSRVRRHGAEDRAGLSACQGPGHAHPADRPRARLSRCRLRRHLGGRHGRQSQMVRPGPRRHRPSRRTRSISSATPSARASPKHGARSRRASSSSLVALHDASNIAAVIVEPVAGSIGVYPPPPGYLQTG